MKQVLLDTNAVMAVGEFGLDVFAAVENAAFSSKIYVVQGTITELKKIMEEQRGKYKAAAKLGLALLTQKKITVLPDLADDVDSSLVEYSTKGYMVLTQDVELKKRLTKPYATIRQKKKVIVVK
ncbi:hypothetical protein CL620_03030 [archaeon]|nr:hypothetical protein [archaeon]|tara:strand:- start:48 stop:419 length:372 start_codon:yes stop_codon:yes gene_type:complete